MTKFADQLFTDLMHEHGSSLATIEPTAAPARWSVSRPVRLTGGLAATAAAVTAGVVVFGGGSPAYALDQNANGTLTLTINRPSGIQEANRALAARGVHAVAVPVRAGCPDLRALPAAPAAAGSRVTTSSGKGQDGSITVDVQGIPAGGTALVAAESIGDKVTLAMAVIDGAAPACVSLPAGPPAGASGGTLESSDDPASGGPVLSTGGTSGTP